MIKVLTKIPSKHNEKKKIGIAKLRADKKEFKVKGTIRRIYCETI